MLSCATCPNSFKTFVVIDGKKRNLSSRRHCLECVPFGSGSQYASAQQREPYAKCALCGKTNGSTRRRRCGSCNTKIRRVRAKIAALQILGGRCVECKYKVRKDFSNMAAFEFHHANGTKDFDIGNIANRRWSLILMELKKCVLVCSRCHRLKHSSREDPRLLAEVLRYEGKSLGPELVW